MANLENFDPYTILNSQKEANKKYNKRTNNKAVKKYISTPKGKEAQRKSKLKSKYGLSPEEYDNKLVNQNHKCAICGLDEVENKKKLAVDHVHATGKIRDLLCINCNTGLGMFKENIENLASAIKYLNKHREDK
jgi:hypothetical protein